VLDANPSYLPALMAVADQKWQSGDRKGALTLYRRVVEQVGPSTDYGQRAAARIAEGSGSESSSSKAAPPAPTSPSASTATSAPTAAAPGTTPYIDTSDLPGVNAP